jgi:hypothetical protein
MAARERKTPRRSRTSRCARSLNPVAVAVATNSNTDRLDFSRVVAAVVAGVLIANCQSYARTARFPAAGRVAENRQSPR